jgi:Domain of unknown function (DUF2027)/Smr domain
MNLRIGDKVSFLNERGGGKITRFMPNGTAMVETTDGFEIPYAVTELVPENYAAHKTITVQPVALANAGNAKAVHLEEGIYLCFMPDKLAAISDGRFAVALYNNTAHDILFNLFGKNIQGHAVIASDRLLAGRSLAIDSITTGDLDKYTGGIFQALFYSGKIKEIKAPESLAFKVKTVKLLEKDNFNVLAHFNAPGIAVALYPRNNQPQTEGDYQLDDLKERFGKENNRNKPTLPKQVFEMEVDLHIEELVSDVRGLNNGDMLQLQLTHARKKLDEAVTAHVRRLILIHGVGNGRLKTEIHKMLKGYTGLEFFDAPYSKYGQGATEVRLGNVRLA